MILNENSLLVAHDAGGANQIISWIPDNFKSKELRFYFLGPAKKIFQQRFPNQKIELDFRNALKESSSLICGTGWQTDTEISAIIEALSIGLPVTAVLDNWGNYASRFLANNTMYLPTEIWVTDRYAYDLAKKEFMSVNIILKKDVYAKNFASKVLNSSVPTIDQVLYICEPMRNQWGKNYEGEFQAIDFFMKKLSLIGLSNSIPIKFRPHPSEDSSKYYKFLEKYNMKNLEIDSESSLENLFSQSRWVVGCTSYALYLAILSKKIVYSALPSWAEARILPHKEIIYLRDI